MKQPLPLLAILLLDTLAAASIVRPVQAADTPASQPNVVILLTDDQGTLDANCYGSTDLRCDALHVQVLSLSICKISMAYRPSPCLIKEARSNDLLREF